jgi:small multidrug resistance family-3 protein
MAATKTRSCRLLPVPPGLGRGERLLEVMPIIRALGLFAITAVAEIIGCYLPYLWLRKSGSVWLLIPGALSLGLFSWLLTLHPAAAGRVYAAYGGVYITVAMVWLWQVEDISPTRWDLTGVAFALIGVAIIMAGAWRS